MRQELHGSLKRLRLERIDVWQLHRIDPKVPEDEQLGAVQEFQREGLIRHVGLSEVSVEQIQRAQRYFPVVSAQNRYSLQDRGWEPELDLCTRENIAFLPWYPLKVGSLARGDDTLLALAARDHASPAQLALAWLLRRSPAMLPIPGTSRVQHLEENMGAADITLSDEDFEALGRGRQ